jgi:hypothetical protein
MGAITKRQRLHQLLWRLPEVGLSLIEHRVTKGDRWPERLDELGLPEEVLTDLCDPDRKPLRYRVEDDGSALVWSVSYDGVDDGGDLTGTYARDYGFRVHPPRAPEVESGRAGQ